MQETIFVMPKSKNVHLGDIAAAAGVNVSTVSSVLGGHADKRRISKILQQKVLAAADELGYRPNLLAQSLRSGKSRLLGLILPDLSSTVYADTCRTVTEFAAKANFRVIICILGNNDNHESLVEQLVDYQVEGIVIVPNTKMKIALFRALEHSGIPFVLADRSITGVNTFQVVPDNFQTGYIATEYLISKGLERIAVIVGTPELNSMKERLAGFEAAMKKHDVRLRPPFIRIVQGDNFDLAVHDSIDNLLEWRPPIDGIAILCRTAFAPAIEQLNKRGIKIPSDMKIVGIDIPPFPALLNPAIAAIKIDEIEIAKRAFEHLMSLIAGEARPPDAVIETVPVVLRTTPLN